MRNPKIWCANCNKAYLKPKGEYELKCSRCGYAIVLTPIRAGKENETRN